MLSLLKIGIESACVSLSLFICFLAYVPTLLNKNFNNCPGIFSTFFFFSRDLRSMLFLQVFLCSLFRCHSSLNIQFIYVCNNYKRWECLCCISSVPTEGCYKSLCISVWISQIFILHWRKHKWNRKIRYAAKSKCSNSKGRTGRDSQKAKYNSAHVAANHWWSDSAWRLWHPNR